MGMRDSEFLRKGNLMRVKGMAVGAVSGVLLLAGMARGVVLPPGTGPTPPTAFASVSGAVLASISGAPIAPPTPNGDTGTYSTEVLVDSGTGKLDFIYQVNAAAANPDILTRLTGFNFSGYTTDVGYTTVVNAVPQGGGVIAPTTVDRNSASTVGFNFMLPPGASGTWLVIKTDASTFTPGLDIGLTNGGTTNLAGFSPVPSPATLWGGAGLFGLMLVGRKCRGQLA